MLAKGGHISPKSEARQYMLLRLHSHVGNVKSLRRYFLFPTWGRKISSEESNETSEEMIRLHVENVFPPRGDLRFAT